MPPQDILVLCYHGVSRSWPAAITVTPERLVAQLSLFIRQGYRGATFTEALTAPPHARTLVVTFDDACQSVLTSAFPVLTRLGLPGTVFVPTMYPDTGVPMGWDGYDRWLGTQYEEELRCLSWDELRTLQAGGWEIGSHTESHPRLTTLDEGSLQRELRASRERCETELGAPCYSIAYPYGDHDDRVVRRTREAGYALAATVGVAATAALPLQWPRVLVARHDSATRVRIRAWRRATPSADAAWQKLAPPVRRVAIGIRRRRGRRKYEAEDRRVGTEASDRYRAAA